MLRVSFKHHARHVNNNTLYIFSNSLIVEFNYDIFFVNKNYKIEGKGNPTYVF